MFCNLIQFSELDYLYQRASFRACYSILCFSGIRWAIFTCVFIRVLLNTPHFLLYTPHTPHTPHQHHTTIWFVRQPSRQLPLYHHYHTTFCTYRTHVKWFTGQTSVAHNRRLKLFAFYNELINDHNALVTTCRVHLKAICTFKKWRQLCFSRERYQNEWNKSSRFIKRNRIHTSQQKLPLWTTLYNTAICILERAYPGSALVPDHCRSNNKMFVQLHDKYLISIVRGGVLGLFSPGVVPCILYLIYVLFSPERAR